MDERIEIAVAAELEALPQALEAIAGFAAAHALAGRIGYAMELVADEIISNIIRHGAVAVGRPPKIRCAAEIDSAAATLTFWDDAAPFDPLTEAPAPDLDVGVEDRKIGGLGAFLVKEMSDACAYRREGDWNRLEVSWRREATA